MRNTVRGSWFVRFFVYVCSSEAAHRDLTSMMTKVLNAPFTAQLIGLRSFNFLSKHFIITCE